MQKDYLLRLIEQAAQRFGQIVARALGLGQRLEDMLEVEQVCVQFTGLPYSVLKRNTPESLAVLLRTGGGLWHHRALVGAEFFLKDAALCEAQGRSAEAWFCLTHAFCLMVDGFEFLPDEQRADYRDRIQRLARQLEALPPDLYLDARRQRATALG